AEWGRLSADQPILLANKQNAKTLHEYFSGKKAADLTPLEADALANSTHGDHKAMALAGAMLENKNKKARQSDTHIGVFGEHFPRTSNNCTMVIYMNIISHLYLRIAQGSDVSGDAHNMLDLGLLHCEILTHIKAIL
ncbi:hypothetical protein GGX14DRAFT_296187, partial [Mycena pura]